MLMVIFGAGASFDSVPEADWSEEQRLSFHRPPLAASLFENRVPFAAVLQEYPEASPLIGELRNALRRDEPVEQALSRYQKLAEDGDELLSRQLLALRFYLHEVVAAATREWLRLANNVTNYSVLLNMIERWRVKNGEDRVILVTFNYDEMLEHGLQSVIGLQYTSMDDYISGNYHIIKPHGSIAWRRLLSISDDYDAHRLIQEAPALRWTDWYVFSGEDAENRAAVPAIAVPTQEKSVFECPLEHIEALKQSLPSVDRVLVVGWRGREESFLGVLNAALGSSEAEALVVSAGRMYAAEAASPIQGALHTANVVASEVKGFSTFVSEEALVTSVLEGRLD